MSIQTPSNLCLHINVNATGLYILQVVEKLVLAMVQGFQDYTVSLRE